MRSCYKPAAMTRALPALLLLSCASMKPPNATEPPDARGRASQPSDRQLGSRTLPGWPQSADDRELVEMLAQGSKWSREQWAAVRLTRRFALRPSAEALQARAKASADAEVYVAGYNLWLHHALTRDGERLFPKGVRLLSHWNLRDQIKAEYGEPDAALGLARQRLIAAIMQQIVAQTIPRSVIDDPRLDWFVDTGRVTAAPAEEIETDQMKVQGNRPAEAVAARDREPDTRYAILVADFRAARRTDADSPLAPTEIDRRFQFDREMPEARVQQLLEAIVASPLVPRVAALIRKRLGRPLEPHDVWYSGFLPRAKYPEA